MRFIQISSLVAIALATMVASAPVPPTDTPKGHDVSLHDVQDVQPQPHHHYQHKHKHHHHHHHHHQHQQSEDTADTAASVPPPTAPAQTTLTKRGGAPKPPKTGKGRKLCAAQQNSVFHEMSENARLMPSSENKGLRLAAGIGSLIEWATGKYKGC